jgi:hypothetical protein
MAAGSELTMLVSTDCDMFLVWEKGGLDHGRHGIAHWISCPSSPYGRARCFAQSRKAVLLDRLSLYSL